MISPLISAALLDRSSSPSSAPPLFVLIVVVVVVALIAPPAPAAVGRPGRAVNERVTKMSQSYDGVTFDEVRGGTYDASLKVQRQTYASPPRPGDAYVYADEDEEEDEEGAAGDMPLTRLV